MEPASHAPTLVTSEPLSAELAEERRARFPIGASLTLAELESYDLGVPLLRRLRAAEPVTWFEELQAWLVTPRPLVQEVLSSHDRFTVEAERNLVRAVLGDHMLSRDGEAHRRQRAPYNPPLRLRPVQENYAQLIEDRAGHLLDSIEALASAELRASYANPLAISVAGGALGLAFGDIGHVAEIYDVFAAKMVTYDDPDVERTTAPARAELDAVVRENIRRMRANPDASIISTVANAESPELRRSDEEIVANVRVLLFGAIETVTSTILSTTWALLTHPDQLAQAVARPELFASAVSEALRWIPPVGFSERWAAVDTELSGVQIRRGEMLLPSITSANRDPAVFPDPDLYDINRSNVLHHDAFSRGAHHCIGTNLANLEARIGVQRLFERLPGLRQDPDVPSTPTGFGFRSPQRLHVICR